MKTSNQDFDKTVLCYNTTLKTERLTILVVEQVLSLNPGDIEKIFSG